MDLKSYLQQQGETLQEFADRSGVPLTTAWRIANGKGGNHFTRTMKLISQATNGQVTLADLAPELANHD